MAGAGREEWNTVWGCFCLVCRVSCLVRSLRRLPLLLPILAIVLSCSKPRSLSSPLSFQSIKGHMPVRVTLQIRPPSLCLWSHFSSFEPSFVFQYRYFSSLV